MKHRSLLKLLGAIFLAAVIAIPLTVGCAAPEPVPGPPGPAGPPGAPGAPAPAPAPEPEPAKETIRFIQGGTPTTSSYYALHAADGRLLMDVAPEVKLTLLETGGSEDNVRNLLVGTIDCAYFTYDVYYQAIHGEGSWEGKPLPNTGRLVFHTNTTSQGYFVRKDSGITCMADLDGRKFYPGHPGWGSTENAKHCLDALGIKPDYFIGDIDDGVAAIKDNRAVGMCKTNSGKSVGAVILNLLTAHEMIPIGFTNEQVSILREKFPTLPFSVVPAGWREMPWPEPLTVHFNVGGMMVREEFPEELGYKWAKAADTHWGNVVEAFTGAETVQPIPDILEWLETYPEILLHPGAIRYMREKGIEIPERNIPPEMK